MLIYFEISVSCQKKMFPINLEIKAFVSFQAFAEDLKKMWKCVRLCVYVCVLA